jgi:hypothetical protein
MTLLSEQPPPRKRGATAGYYPDPLGSGRARYWDGANWTHQLGPLVAEGAAKGTPVPSPTKVCRHCGAQSETFDSTCPNCGRAYGQRTGFVVAAIVAACVGVVLLLGACGVAIVAITSNAAEEYEISEAQFNSIELGSSREAVENRLGDPFDRTHEHDPPYGEVLCITYTQEDGDLFDIFDPYEFCFDDGRLYEKHRP